MTLVETALAARSPKKSGRPSNTPEELIELSLAWARGEVSTGQCIAATKLSDSNLYGRIASCLRAAVQQGRLVDINKVSANVRGWR